MGLFVIRSWIFKYIFTPVYKNNQYHVDELSSIIKDLLKWLTFRLNYASGILKLTHQCSTSQNLTALKFYIQSQPLPNTFSWYFYNLPEYVWKFFEAQTFINLVFFFCSILIYLPLKSVQFFGFLMILSQQIMIFLSGNYNFFNFLTILVSFSCIEDEYLNILINYKIQKLLGIKNVEQNKGKIRLSEILIMIFIVLIIHYMLFFKTIFYNEEIIISENIIRQIFVDGLLPLLIFYYH
ncbi:lmf2 protein, putative [Ichthyophthirius multifiliis]|uniref:Lmf2 protein, putative n=1 Tax=Ichthyophthirius multifiliis TaxID=5932 RepID=G0QRU5_ICHMU|nr:lmf2 protein, putative [Ichthyophthirius multifiliis]EGR32079.1 lmf2 protein, putative [Ichthyophthirius multifiliis]|eukprot:XP_004035565.1 lmf2 protein, putative [Ichthyophthirius multifiliis]